MPEYYDLFGGPGATVVLEGRARKRTVTSTSEVDDLLAKAWALVALRWASFIDGETNGFLSPDLTDGVACVYFIRSKYLGEDYPRTLSLCFVPSQVTTAGDAGSLRGFLDEAASGDLGAVTSLRWFSQESTTFANYVNKGLAVHGHRMPLDFPAVIAAEIMDKYCPQGGSVLDPCHGWGGRLVGFLLANKPREYVGVDPSLPAHDGVYRAFNTLLPFAEKDKTAVFHKSPFEKAKLKGPFDFAFTGPPYFDVEKYDGPDQSFRKYKTFDLWCANFYRPLFERTFSLLKKKSYFALNVGSQKYPLVDKAREFADAAGFQYVSMRTGLLKEKVTFTNTAAERGESLLVFRKK